MGKNNFKKTLISGGVLNKNDRILSMIIAN